MEEQIDTIDQEIQGQAKRSQFLTVLCILTFIGSGLAILGALWGFVPSTAENGLKAMRDLRETSFNIGDFSEAEYLKWTFYTNIAGLIGGLICVGAAFLMWQLKKIGFFLYIAGYLIPFTLSIFATEHMLTGDLSGIGTITVVVNGLIMLTFFIMYAVNLKHMK